jgi:hypothetical protein
MFSTLRIPPNGETRNWMRRLGAALRNVHPQNQIEEQSGNRGSGNDDAEPHEDERALVFARRRRGDAENIGCSAKQVCQELDHSVWSNGTPRRYRPLFTLESRFWSI